MPAADALGPDHDQVTAAVSAESADHNPEELVAGAEPRSPPSRRCQQHELLTEQEILGDERLAVAHSRTEKAEEQQQQQVLEHRPNIVPLNTCSRPGRPLHPHRAAVIPAAVKAADLGSSEVERSVVQFGSQLWSGV
jgi:hypothetical protein